MASQKNGTLYIGITSDLARRIDCHKSKVLKKCFTSKYNVTTLVYFEVFDNVIEAMAREKRLKKWRRAWKIKLIENLNPSWKDLSNEI